MNIDSIMALHATEGANPAIAIAACRAGALGVLDLEHYTDVAGAVRAVLEVRRFTTAPFGLRISPNCEPLREKMAGTPVLPRPIRVILAGGASGWREGQAVQAWRQLGCECLLEAVSLAEALEARGLGCQGVVLKGHEAGGRIGEETSFVLLQQWQREGDGLPAWLQGGIGKFTAAGGLAGGAAGIVLDSQLLLTREARPSPAMRKWLAASDGSETRRLGESIGLPYRLAAPAGSTALSDLEAFLQRLEESPDSLASRQQQWRGEIARRVSQGELPYLIGQDSCFAEALAQEYVTVGGVLLGLRQSAENHLRQAQQLQPLAAGSPLADTLGTHFPILQGPMTRVSDTAEFAFAVAQGGALPFLALALLRGHQTLELLEQTKSLLKQRPWGVGLLGFLPAEVRQEQIEAILTVKPPFALIAGGRPDQAQALEKEGIPTFLHVPSPGLLKMFLKDGARKFIFEGRECGGHVGPRTSFVLWETMCRVLLEHLGPHGSGKDLQVVFAGGIHDDRSAAMAAAIAAPLVHRGVKFGVLMGTAYLFTREAVQAGAIVERFQEEAIRTRETVLLETGPGHAIRVLHTPYCDDFQAERRRLKSEGRTHEEIVKTLEWMNIGRLRVASKGVDRLEQETGGQRKLGPVSQDQQFKRGMYMIGQVAAMQDRVVGVRELHELVSQTSGARLDEAVQLLDQEQISGEARPCDVAIVGFSCFYPAAQGLQSYWRNILRKHYAVTEIPAQHWDWRIYYDENPRAKDKIISKWGGFLSDVAVDPLVYGVTPKSIPSIEPLQLLLLEAVRQALGDAGYSSREFARDKTCAVLGIGGGGGPMSVFYGLRSCLPMLDTVDDSPATSQQILQASDKLLPEWTEDSFPGFLMNVAVGRVANRFDLGGSNYALDAACASSLAAVHACVRELELGTADMALAMGADTVQTPYAYMAFSKTHALSALGRCRPFDAEADGIVLSEGIGIAVLKRLADAQRDGDQIYAVIRGIGSSSDGKDKGLTAPNAAGQLRAIRRAWEQAGISPATAGLIEAHGTGTVVGDQTEAQALSQVMSEAGAANQSCAMGSVKSMIGHSKCAAGIAGLIKAALALHHKVLPPTLVETPSPRIGFETSPLYLNADARPWVQAPNRPRRAGVSAFGFGGTNVHVALEEYTGDFLETPSTPMPDWPIEVFVWRAATRDALEQQVRKFLRESANVHPQLAELAASLWQVVEKRAELPTLSVIADSLEQLRERLEAVLTAWSNGAAMPLGAYHSDQPQADGGKVAFLFPGQGAQHVDMLSELAIAFPEARQTLDMVDLALEDAWDRPLSRYIFPPSAFTPEARSQADAELTDTEVAQPAVGAVSLAALRLLRSLGVEADVYAGHSFGEWTALQAAGVIDQADFSRLALSRGRLMKQAAEGGDSGGMLAIQTDAATAKRLIAGHADVYLANFNAPRQVVLSGAKDQLQEILKLAQKERLAARILHVACAFHSPLIAGAAQPFAVSLDRVDWSAPRTPVYSNETGQLHGDDPNQLRDAMRRHMASSVRFDQQIESMYAAGVRTFVEVGPRNILSGLTNGILGDRPHVAAPLDRVGGDGLRRLAELLALLITRGVAVDFDSLFRRRGVRQFAMQHLSKETGEPNLSPSTWLVNGIRCRPLRGPEPRLIGQRPGWTAAPEGAAGAAATVASEAPIAPTTSTATASNVEPRQKLVAPSHSTQTPTAQGSSNGEPPAPRPDLPATAIPRSRPLVSTSQRPEPAPHPVSQQQGKVMSEGASSTPRPASPSGCDDETARVMLGFQELMARFLDTQREVMLSFLGELAPPASSLLSPSPASRIPPHLEKARELTRGISGSTPPTSHQPPSSGPLDLASSTAAPPVASPPVAAPHLSAGNNGARGQNGQYDNAAASRGSNFESLAPSGPAATAAVSAEPLTSESVHVEAPAEAVSATPKEGQLSRQEIETQLLDLVSDRTGYPQEMLDLDLDLEADLGIDSIKRVEILGSLAESISSGEQGDLSSKLELEKLTTIRTLRGILEYLDHALFSEVATSAAASSETEPLAMDLNQTPALDVPPESGSAPLAIQRGGVELVDAPLPTGGSPVLPRGGIVITDDGRGIAIELAERLSDFGQRTILLRHQSGPLRAEDGLILADLDDPGQATEAIAAARRQTGSLGGLVHAAPLGTCGDEPLQVKNRRDVRSLFLLAQAMEVDLLDAAQHGSAALLAASNMGGGLGLGEPALDDPEMAIHAGISGFLKCLPFEWPGVLIRAVDMNADDPSVSRLAEQLLGELTDRDGPVVVGHVEGRRVSWEPTASPLDVEGAPLRGLDRNSVVLITGGARGITAEVALDLAKRYQPRLMLLGRSPQPTHVESEDTVSLADQADIKAALMSRLRRQGKTPTPAEVEVLYRELMRDREIRRTLQGITDNGSLVEYHSVDVRDAQALGHLVAGIQQRHGRLDGVIHGAGVIEDKLLRDKTPESFDRVFNTKVDGALNLMRLLDPEQLQFVIFFASVAGTYGNRGQADYAAANEVLCKLACELDRRWAARVAAICWGPWSGAGMVAELSKHFRARGVSLISPREGARYVRDEILHGPKGQCEVLVAGGAARLAHPVAANGAMNLDVGAS